MNNKLTLGILAVLFFGPLVTAYVWFFYFTDVTTGTVNKGDLVDPAVQVSSLAEAAGAPAAFNGQWAIVHVVRDGCQSDCQQSVFLTRQVWTRLNKDASRVQRYVLLEGDADMPVFEQEHRDLEVMRADAKTINQAFEGIPVGRIYLVDPNGFLMMSYPQPLVPDDLFDDLRRLMKYSKTGEVQ
ncbi:MAG: hypothetical protein R3217_08005 [Gammaproteobacteria bacterium]|nr:hypothetical protein [Gammaproteobacteria bacterium]